MGKAAIEEEEEGEREWKETKPNRHDKKRAHDGNKFFSFLLCFNGNLLLH